MQALRVCAAVTAAAATLACGPNGAPSDEAASRVVRQAAEEDSPWIRLEFSPRRGHTATLLPDGRVLITGGVNGSETLSDAEIFDATTGEQEPVGRMCAARSGHTATLLRNGEVLIVGGVPGDAPTCTAELFVPGDLDAGREPRFVPIDPGLTEPRRKAHTATLLRHDTLGSEVSDSKGIVVIAGGCADPRHDPALTCAEPLSSLEVYEVDQKQFEPLAAVLQYPRARHRATLKPDDDVLFTGGTGLVDPDPTAEILGGSTGSVSELPLTVSHNAHTATLLHSREVLVAGNWALTGGGARAEVIGDTGTPRVLNMLQSRSWHTATLLPHDQVLLVGGMSPDAPTYPALASVEAYSAHSDTFVAAPALHDARMFHTATLLPDASLLVMGGSDENGQALASAELLRPTTTASTLVAGETQDMQLLQAAAVRLRDGRVLVTGGRSTEVQRHAYLFTPAEPDDATGESNDASGTWTQVPDMMSPRAGHTATLFPNGAVLIAGGRSGLTTFADSAELYMPDPAPGSFIQLKGAVRGRVHHTATLLGDGSVLLVGGEDQTGPLATADFVSPDAQAQPLDAHMSRARSGHTATRLPSGKVLIAGGSGDTSAELYDPATKTFRPTDGDMRQARRFHSATVLPSRKVLIAGGNSRRDAEVYDEQSGQFVRTHGDMQAARSNHTATLLMGGRVLLAGGDAVLAGGDAQTTELYDSVSEDFVAAAPLQRQRASHAAALLADGSVLLVGGLSPGLLERWREDAGNAFQFRPLFDILSGDGVLRGGQPVELGGSRFTCMSEANGGSPSTAATNHPIVIWMPNEGAPSVGGKIEWASDHALWQAPKTAYPGPGLLFVVVNGMRSVARSATIAALEPGQPCVTVIGGQCASGSCVEGICCNSACDAECQQCGTGTCEVKQDGESCTGGICGGGSCEMGRCNSTRNCSPGLVCGSDHMCRIPTLAADDEGPGCTCRAARQRASSGWLAAALILLAARRRRSAGQKTYAAES